MPTFSYNAVDPSGSKKSGVVEAASEQAAVALVMAEGRYVLDIKESASIGSDKPAVQKTEKKKGRATRSDLALYTRRMADLSSAGLPLDRALQVMAEQTESGPLAEASENALKDVREGLSVSDAFAKSPKIFPQVYTETLHAGEMSGQFPESCERLADLLENEVARRSQIVSALIYPAVLTLTAVFVVIFLLTFVVPRLAVVFEGLGDELPAPTKLLLGSTDFLITNWIVIVGTLVGGFIAFRLYSATDAGKYFKDKLMLNLPMFGPIVRKAVISRYARVLGTLVHGGVPILESISLAGLASGNRVFQVTSHTVEEEVREGRPIATAMKDTGVFPPVLTHMVAIGEETGDLSKMLTRVSDSLDFEVEQSLRRATAALEPIIVLVMGAFVAFVVLSVLLPIFEAQSLVK